MHVVKYLFHVGNISVIVSTSAWLINLQFHVSFDDNFTNLSSIYKGNEPPNWNHLRFECSGSAKFHFIETCQWSHGPDSEALIALNLLGFGAQHPTIYNATPPSLSTSLDEPPGLSFS